MATSTNRNAASGRGSFSPPQKNRSRSRQSGEPLFRPGKDSGIAPKADLPRIQRNEQRLLYGVFSILYFMGITHFLINGSSGIQSHSAMCASISVNPLDRVSDIAYARIPQTRRIMAAGVGFHHCQPVFEMIFYAAKLEIDMLLQFFGKGRKGLILQAVEICRRKFV